MQRGISVERLKVERSASPDGAADLRTVPLSSPGEGAAGRRPENERRDIYGKGT